MSDIATKLTYLNTTKQKIKDSINALGGNLTNESTFRSYAAALDNIYNVLPKTTGTGETLSLTPTLPGKLVLGLKGNTEQVQLSGKNIIASFRESTANRINYNLDTNGLTTTMVLSLISNISVSDVAVNLRTITDAGVYTMGNISLVANTRISFSFTLTTTQINTLKSTDSVLQLYKGSSGLSGVSLSEVQIENGTGTATSYEQYCGGSPSPNPDFPQDIHNVSGNNSIVVCGKNLFDKNDITTGLYYYASGTSTSENWAIAQVRVQPNTNYYLSGNNYNNTTAKIVLLNSSKNIISDVGVYKDVHLITTNSNTAYIGLSIANYEGSSDLSSIQLEQGNQPSTYEAYNGNTYPINLPNGMELCKIGTYQDYIYKEDDKWYLHKETGKLIINGTENPTLNTSSTNTTRVLYSGVLNQANKTDRLLLCNYLEEKSNYSNDIEGAFYSTSSGDYWFRINKSTIGTTTSDVNTWLSNHNVINYFALNTPTNTEITDTTLLSQLEAIYNAKSKNGTTNISQVNNDLGFIITASCLKGA